MLKESWLRQARPVFGFLFDPFLRDSSIYLVKWQALLDTESLIYVNKNLGGYIAAEIQKGTCPIKLQLTGRKGTKNIKPYYTFIGRDAIDALKKYFEQEREGGYPKAGEPIWYSNKHFANGKPRPYEYWSLGKNQLTLCRKLGIVTKKLGDRSSRHGKGPHEMRDTARSFLHVKGKPDGLDAQAIEYFMGHGSQLDQLGYDRFYENEEYMLNQYKIMEKHLNVLSTPPSLENGKIKALREEFDGKLEVIAEAIEREAKTNPEIEQLKKLTILAKSLRRTEGMEITKADMKELTTLIKKLEELMALADSGVELDGRYQLESYMTQERTKQLMAKFYEAMTSKAKTSKGKLLDREKYFPTKEPKK